MKIWIENWQVESLKSPFKLYDTVSWPCLSWDNTMPKIHNLTHLDYYYENLSLDDVQNIEGVITNIQCVYQAFELDSLTRVNVPQYGMLRDFESEFAYGLEPDVDEYTFVAYIVTLQVN